MSRAGVQKALADKKVKRQKQMIAFGSVILLALLGFQLPKLLGGGSEQAAPPLPVPSAPSQPGSPLAVAPGKLPNTDHVVVQPQTDKLLSFGLFKSKDPFVQQLSTNPDQVGPSPSPVPPPETVTQPVVPPTPGDTTPTGTTTPGTTVPIIPPPSTTPSPTTPTGTTTTPAPAPTAVALATNGSCEEVALKGTFPSDEDIFRLVWIARDGKSVKIAIVGGAYDSGVEAATLKLGDKLTLVNTADGTRYVIVLKAKCDVKTAPVPTAPTTTSTTTTTTTTTTTATTPIVTDSLDTTTPTG